MLSRVGKVGRLGSIGGLEGIPAPDLQLNFDQASIGANAAPDDAIDFSRASQATFTDSDGLVKYAPHNLGLYSEDLSNVNWNVTAVTKSSNTDTAPDGTTTADKITEDTANSGHRIRQGGLAVVSGKHYSLSVYLKISSGTRNVDLRFSANNSAFSFSRATFDLVNGTAENNTSFPVDNLKIENVGNDWYRCSVVEQATATTNATFEIGLNDGTTASYTGDGSSSVLIWGAQFSQHKFVPVGNPYIKTTSAAVYGARLDHEAGYFDGDINNLGTGATQNGLLIEEQRVNLISNGDNVNTYYSNQNSTETNNQVISPDGTVNGDLLIPTTYNGTHTSFNNTLTISTSTSHSYSMFAKADGYDFIQLMFTSGFNNNDVWANFNLSTGVVASKGSGATSSIEDYGNGWFRCVVIGASGGSAGIGGPAFSPISSDIASREPSFAGDGTSGIYIWGAQLEEGAFPTSYIPTSGSSVTRSADLATMGPVTGTNLILQSEDISTTWSTFRASITTNDIVAPDGLTTADKLVEDTNNDRHRVSQTITKASGQINYVYSFYAKADERENLEIHFRETSFNDHQFVKIDLGDGTITSVGRTGTSNATSDPVATITPVGNDWFKIGIYFLSATDTFLAFENYLATESAASFYTGDGSSGMHLWGFQLEQAPTLITDAEDFSAWTISNASVSTNVIAAPDGNTTADKIVENTANSSHFVFKSPSTSGGKTHTTSVFAKAAERDTLEILLGSGAYGVNVKGEFDLTNVTATVETAGTNTSVGITDVGNGWFRCFITSDVISTASSQHQFRLTDNGIASYTGDGSSGLYLWGAQIEEGASATPYPPEPTKYLPTYASTNLPFVGYNHNQGTINSEFTALGSTAFARFYDFVDNTDALNEKIALSNRSASDPDEGTESIVTGGANQIFNAFDLTPNVFIKYSRAYKTNDSAAEIKDGTGGVDSHSDTSVTLPTTINELGIGSRPDNGTNIGNFVMKRFHYYASRLKNDFLKRLR